MSTQNVNVARFARTVEWDFFCDFQTPCSFWATHYYCTAISGSVRSFPRAFWTVVLLLVFSPSPWARANFDPVMLICYWKRQGKNTLGFDNTEYIFKLFCGTFFEKIKFKIDCWWLDTEKGCTDVASRPYILFPMNFLWP